MAKGGPKEVCTVDGCSRTRVGWGYCGLHYGRLKRLGSIRPTHRSQARAETIGPDGRRKCWKCGERKPFTGEFFAVDYRRPGELKGTCKQCLDRAHRKCSLSRRYGITEEELESRLAAQGHKCALCLRAFDGMSKVSSPHIDHDHSTGAVRGVLCHHCNVLLGHAKDSVDLLRSAISYLGGANANP